MRGLKERLRYYFIPSEKNNYRAKSIQHDFLTYYLVVAFAFVFLVKSYGGTLTNVLGVATDITPEKLYEETNVQRQKNNLSTLTYNQKLSDAAYQKAKDMFAKNYWSHFAPDGHTPWDFILDSGYNYEFAGENLAKNFLFSQNVVDAWMQSPSHRENMLKSEYTDVGYAVVNGVLNGEETTLVVQMFGKPSARQIAARPSPASEIEKPAEEKAVPSVAAPKSEVLATSKQAATAATKSKVSALTAYLFIFFMLFVIAIDFLVANKLNLVRLHGKSLAHFIFFAVLFVGLFLFISRGAIL